MRTHTLFAAGLLAAVVPSASAADGFALEEEPGKHLTVRHGETPVARYMVRFDLSAREETYKPFMHVLEPDGEETITKGPHGRYSHHRGVFRGWGGLELGGDTYDTWHMEGVVQEHRRFADRSAGEDQASFTSVIAYRKDGGELLLKERRKTTFRHPPADAYAMFDVVSTVRATEGAVLLGGDPEHAGLQFRAANNIVNEKTRYTFSRPDANPRAEADSFRWVAMSFVIDEDERYTVLYLNHPENPDGVNFSAYRDYGRFGAWFNGRVPEGGSDTVRVRFLVFEGGTPSPELMHDRYNAYAGTDQPTPEVTVQESP